MFATFTKMKVIAIAAVAATGLVAGTQQASAHDNFNLAFSFGLPVYTAPAPGLCPGPRLCRSCSSRSRRGLCTGPRRRLSARPRLLPSLLGL